MTQFRKPKVPTVIGTVLVTVLAIALPIGAVKLATFGQEPQWWLVWLMYGLEVFIMGVLSLSLYTGNRDYKRRKGLIETLTQQLTGPAASVPAMLILSAEDIRTFTLVEDRTQCITVLAYSPARLSTTT